MSFLPSSIRRALGLVSTAPLLHLGLALAQIAGFLAFAGPLAAIHGFPLDDAWIHQVVGRTFAESGTLGYSAGHHGAGATSYLWAALLAVNYRFVHADPVAFTFALNAVFMLGAGQLLLAMVLRARPDEDGARLWSLKSFLVVALASVGGNYLWFAFSGMEAVLFVFLSLLAILVFTSPGRTARSAGTTALLAGMCAGALALTRPEGAVLGPLLAVASLKLRRRSWRDAALVLAPWAACLAVYLGTNLLASGTALPATLSGRKWLWANGNAGLSHREMLVDFFEVWSLRLRDYTLGTSSMAAFWASFALLIFGVARFVRGARASFARAHAQAGTAAPASIGGAALVLTLLWAAIHLATYSVMMPSPGHGGRYQPLVPLLYLAGVAFGSIALVEEFALLVARAMRRAETHRAVRAGAALAAVVPWFALVSVGIRDWQHDHAKAVSHIRETEVGLGALVDRLPAGAVVASFDIGGVGFASARPIIDAGGLSEKRTATLLAEGRIWEYLKETDVAYLILPLTYREDAPEPMNFGFRLSLFENPAIELEPIRNLESPPEVWIASIRSTWNSAPRQTMFRVRYTGAPAAAASARLGKSRGLRDPEGLLRARERAVVEHSLSVLAGVDVPVELTVRADAKPEPDAASKDDAWRVSLGKWGVEILAPAGQPEGVAGAARAVLAEWVQPYVEIRDFGGAAAMVPHVIAQVLRRTSSPTLYPLLPPVPAPIYRGGVSEVETTASWGAPLALLVLALAFARSLAPLAARGLGGLRALSRAARARRAVPSEEPVAALTGPSRESNGGAK